MRLHYVLIFLFVSLAVFTNCGEDSEEPADVIESGDIYGTVIDKEIGNPIQGASVDIGGSVALTDEDGRYALEGILLSDKIDVVVTAANYREYKDVILLDQKLLLLDIDLYPIDSPSVRILGVLEAISEGVEALDPNKIPFIQSHFSEDYVASDNPVTFMAVWAGFIPPDFDRLPETILTIIGKCDKIEFKFTDPNVESSGNLASVLVRFEVCAETKPPKPKQWNIIVDGRIDFQNQKGDWKVTYWELVSDFIKFEDKPLQGF